MKQLLTHKMHLNHTGQTCSLLGSDQELLSCFVIMEQSIDETIRELNRSPQLEFYEEYLGVDFVEALEGKTTQINFMGKKLRK